MNTATVKQIEFINRLQAERRWETTPAMATMVEDARFAWRKGEFSKRDASLLIHDLGFMPRRDAEVAKSADAVEDRVSLEGMHRLGGKIYKVQVAVNGSGNEYAKELRNLGDVDGFGFVYAPGVVRKLSVRTRLTLEEAKEFGALYGTCCVCGRTLTDEKSIAAGIGPVCAGKF
jgi:hypothetical protein